MQTIKLSQQGKEAYLAKRKTMTRRPMKPQPMDEDSGYFTWVSEYGLLIHYSYDELFKLIVEDGYSPYVIGEEVSLTDEDGNGFARDRIKSVRAERLQDISEEDAIAEGIIKSVKSAPTSRSRHVIGYVVDPEKDGYFSSHKDAFETAVWRNLPYKPPLDWDGNPWVWVYEFYGYGESTLKENA